MTATRLIKKRKELWYKNKDLSQDLDYIRAVADFMVSDEGEELREEVKEAPELLVELVFYVVDKEQNTVPFFLNDLQQQFIKEINKSKKEYEEGKRNHLKFLLLKGRQGGFTTIITAYQLAISIVTRNFAGYTLADSAENTESIFTDKAKFFYDYLPGQLKPTEKYNNRRELHFEKLNSRWRVATAGNKDVGRSKTLNFFHGSEVAFWRDSRNLLTGLEEALTKDAIEILETTANGFNEYKDLWDNKDNNWTKLFFEWWHTKEYALTFEDAPRAEIFKKRVLTSSKNNNPSSRAWIYYKCKTLVEQYQLDWSQVYWYYNKWKDTKDKIMQEYPCTPEEAFLASGRCVFNTEQIGWRKRVLAKQQEESPPRRGNFIVKYRNQGEKDKIISYEFKEHPYGTVWIYEEPQKGYPYALGGDTKGEGSDKFAATVINNHTGRRVLTLHGDMQSQHYTHQVYCIGMYYNEALVGIETNFNTYPIEELERLEYPNQYTRERYDTYTGATKKAFGFRTDGTTRPLIIERAIETIDNNIENFTHIPFLDECLTFVYDENGRPDAESGKHDDILFSDMIADETSRQQSHDITFDDVKIEGYYTRAELEDLGYSEYEIEQIRDGMVPI